MRILSASLCLLGLGLFSACAKTPEVPAPDTSTPEFTMADLLKSCNKPESQQTAVAPQVLAGKVVVEARVGNIDIETVDCDGKVTKKEHGPERELIQFVQLKAPPKMAEPVAYVSIEDQRTCQVFKFDAGDGKIEGQSISLPDGTQSPFTEEGQAGAERSGKVLFGLTERSYNLGLALNVSEGLNVLKVRYFGKCQKLKPEADRMPPTIVPDDSYLNCAEDREIGKADFVLQVHVARPELPGKKTVTVCEKKE